MAVSNSTSFTVTRDQIIEAALQDLSVLEEGAQPSSAALVKGSFALNLIIKDWQTTGIKLWTVDNLAIPLVKGKTVYTIGSALTNDVVSHKPLKVIQGFLRNNVTTPNIDIPMLALSRNEYNTLGSKFSQGRVNSYFYNPKATHGELSLFLTPSDSAYTLYVVVQRPIMDIISPTDTFDFPSEWFLALKWALMSELSSSYDKALMERSYYDTKALFFKTSLEEWDVENTSVFFTMDARSSMTKGYR